MTNRNVGLVNFSSMSPALHNDSTPFPAAVPSKGPSLAIGSLSTAQDGKYQTLIADLESSRKVDKQMLDRLVDGGAQYPSIGL
jgi:hypothetical protein